MQPPGARKDASQHVQPGRGPAFCFAGIMDLVRPLSAEGSETVVGQLKTGVGVAIPLVQTATVPFGPSTLAELDQQPATVCGNLLFHDGRLALDVLYAAPGVSTATPGVSPLALVVLALLGLLPAAR